MVIFIWNELLDQNKYPHFIDLLPTSCSEKREGVVEPVDMDLWFLGSSILTDQEAHLG